MEKAKILNDVKRVLLRHDLEAACRGWIKSPTTGNEQLIKDAISAIDGMNAA